MVKLTDNGVFDSAGRVGWRAALLLLDALPDPAWIKDANGVYLAVNSAYWDEYRSHGGNRSTQIVGKRAADIYDARTAAELEAEDRALLRSGGSIRYLREMTDRHGRSRSFEIRGFVVHGQDGEAIATMAFARQIDERATLLDSLNESERKLQALIGNLPGVLFRCRNDGLRTMEYISSGVAELTGYAPETFFDGSRTWSSVVHFADRERVCRQIREQLADGGRYTVEYRIVRLDGGIRYLWERGVCLGDPASAESLLEAYAHDITDATQRMQRLEYLATHDELTGLANRHGLVARIGEALADPATRHRVAVVAIDLDKFRFVNGNLGHEGGDRVLIEMAARLRRHAREGELACRFGSDAFGILMLVDGPDQLGGRVDALLADLASPMMIDGREVCVSATAGNALVEGAEDTAEQLLGRADVAMTQARALGRGRHARWLPEVGAQGERRLRLIAALRRALEREQLSLAFQPIVAVADGKVAGAEALLRWSHPELGEVSPELFIPLAEESGLIQPIGAWVIEQACRELVALRREGRDFDYVSVNVSVLQLRDPRFAGMVADVLQRTGLEPRRLALEVTESCAMIDPEGILRRLRALKALGVTLVMDDFGTGWSSLAQLRSFPVDHVKLDRLFIHGMEEDEGAAQVCEAVVRLAHALRLVVVAEGVETEAQRQYLGRIGCDRLQGYLIARPMPAALLRSFQARAA